MFSTILLFNGYSPVQIPLIETYSSPTVVNKYSIPLPTFVFEINLAVHNFKGLNNIFNVINLGFPSRQFTKLSTKSS
jgi:hypothetical protein